MQKRKNEFYFLVILCYNQTMNIKKHWSVDTNELAKNPEAFAIWTIEQRINWGIGKERLKIAELQKYWNKIEIDFFKRRALELVIF